MKPTNFFSDDDVPRDRSGEPKPGYVVIGETTTGRVVVHAEPGAEVPKAASPIGAGKPPAEALASYNGRARVLEATWKEKDADGNEVLRRGKLADVPEGITPEETDLLPHLWAGEEA